MGSLLPRHPGDLGRGVIENQETLGFLLAQVTEFTGSLSDPSGAPVFDPDSPLGAGSKARKENGGPTLVAHEAPTKDAHLQVCGRDLLQMSTFKAEGATHSLPMPCSLCPPSHSRDLSVGVTHHGVVRGCQQWGGTCNMGLTGSGG